MTMHRELRTCELMRLERFRPRRVRPDWRAMFWKALRLLVLSAICGAAWSAGKAEEAVPHAEPLTKRERVEGVWIAGGLLLGLMALVALAVRKQGRESRGLGEAYAEEDPYAGHWGYDGHGRPIELIPDASEVTGVTAGTSLTESATVALAVEIVKPAKHGFVIDLQDGDRRTQVRVFEFERQEFMPGDFCEMPVTLSSREAEARLRAAMESLSTWADVSQSHGLPVSLSADEGGAV